jgi:hypothetical protein
MTCTTSCSTPAGASGHATTDDSTVLKHGIIRKLCTGDSSTRCVVSAGRRIAVASACITHRFSEDCNHTCQGAATAKEAEHQNDPGAHLSPCLHPTHILQLLRPPVEPTAACLPLTQPAQQNNPCQGMVRQAHLVLPNILQGCCSPDDAVLSHTHQPQWHRTLC